MIMFWKLLTVMTAKCFWLKDIKFTSLQFLTLNAGKDDLQLLVYSLTLKLRELLGNPYSLIHHNVTGNGKREGLKRLRIGQSAAKGRIGQGSTTIPNGSRAKRPEVRNKFYEI